MLKSVVRLFLKQSVLDSIEKLKDDDLITLNYLYLYRAMDIEQIMTAIYQVDTSIPSGKRKRTVIIKRLQAESVVTISKYLPQREALQITNKGIEIVRYTRNIPNQIFDENTKTIKRGYYTSADLKLGNRFINHQVHLNQFMLDFSKRADELKIPYLYYDEKFLSQYVGMRPDGMITMYDTDFFIEIDMATESKQQLLEKWDHYREFMRSSEFRYKQRKIVVLFDTDNLVTQHKVDNRKNLVKKTIIKKILDQVNGDFDIVVGSREELISYLFNNAIPSILNRQPDKQKLLQYLKQLGYTISFGFNLNKLLHGDFYNYYIRQLDENGKITKNGPLVNEWFMDFYNGNELSVLHRIDWYRKNTALYKEKYHRNIRLIVAVNDIEEAFRDFELLGQHILGQTGIYLLDLKHYDPTKKLFKNLYKIGLKGEVFTFETSDLSRTAFQYKLNKDKINHQQGRLK